jgi:hypothetical protein
LFLDSLLRRNEPVLDYPDTGDVMSDLRGQTQAVVDLLGTPPWGPFTRPWWARPSKESVTHDYLDRVFQALFAGMGP